MKQIVVRKGRDESIRRFHPWIFSGAVLKISGEPKEGDVVEVLSSTGDFLAYGHYQIGSISVRILAFDKQFTPADDAFGEDFWMDRLSKALDMRKSLHVMSSSTDSYRLVHGEGDSLPGLIIDFYNGVAVMQAHSAGMFLSRDVIAATLKKLYGDALLAVYDKSEGTAPFKAGLELGNGYLLKGNVAEGNNEAVVMENSHKFLVNWEEGQKTGFFLDQRDNRRMVGEYSEGRRVLNLFCYTGGFSIYALAAGAASVVSVDSSKTAIDLVEKNIDLNFPEGNVDHTSVCDDAIEYLKNVPEGAFDLMVVDPPAFAKHRGALDNALRAYRRLNSYAISKIAHGGLIFTYSCSQVVDKQAFALAVFSAAAQTGRRVKILRRLTQPADHPVNIYHPEGEYLKGLLLYVE